MANSSNAMPIVLDTDITSFKSAQTLQAAGFGLRVTKFALVSNGTSSAGTVLVQATGNSQPLTAPMNVSAGNADGTILFYDNPTYALMWPDFKVTGLTSTSTKLYVWYRV